MIIHEEGQQLYDHPWELKNMLSKACLQCSTGKTYDSPYVGFTH
jgi:hypothetical protein